MKQCQVIALAGGKKTRTERAITDLYKTIQSSDLLDGFLRTYKPRDEEGEALPPEQKVVQIKANDILTKAYGEWKDLINLVGTMDVGNCDAKADVSVDGTVILPQVPVTHLLFLEKHLTDMRTFVLKIPTLNPSEQWAYDAGQAVFRSSVTQTVRTKKVPRSMITAPATEQHPAQIHVYTEDIPVGNWELTKFSAAMTSDEKAKIVSKIEKLQDAVKAARELANASDVTTVDFGTRIVNFLTS